MMDSIKTILTIMLLGFCFIFLSKAISSSGFRFFTYTWNVNGAILAIPKYPRIAQNYCALPEEWRRRIYIMEDMIFRNEKKKFDEMSFDERERFWEEISGRYSCVF